MSHLIIAPILLPILTAIIIMLPPVHYVPNRRRLVSIVATALQLIIACCLLWETQQNGLTFYAVGDWQPPFGIILVADTLSVVMVCLTTFLALAAICYGAAGEDVRGSFFHPLFHFQIMGINGAFLTGDLFNLFVFFEVLLIASYGLLIHAGGKNKTKAAVHYVVLNLAGSAVFLFSLAILYGALGTLNIADMALKVSTLPPEDVLLVKAGGLLLLIVFSLKAAVLPLQFWLPDTYAAASPPVAALFAVMTKIGVYALLRVYTTIFGESAGPLAGLGMNWLWPFGLATIVLGAIGVMGSLDFRKVVANLVIVSVGTLVCLVAMQNTAANAAVLYYTVHSTLVTGALFLLADMIANQRGKAGDRLVSGRRVAQPVLLGSLFFAAAVTVAGLPPLSGFIGKLMILQSAVTPLQQVLLWSVVLLSSLMVLIGLSRAGSILFWRVTGSESGGDKALPLQVFAVSLLLLASPMLVVFAGPFTELSVAAAVQLEDVSQTISTILLESSVSGGAQ
ncbi:monovalent cation/H+ antiporter subunit D [Alishewanella sp. 16-MA]|uniref:Monovalent cation/H+ antiporter subunit D n=1 Tax=Alishewanella maricola TaxID=2795740 RepID=A0ABS8BYW0_9ALTE|nr:monovalent cation/H+ antiporter subunit D [Alishewanella maricola]MCB5225250.1 monovalent cation/H+ antiporter subunit D [Alishewanella maricola]